MTHPIGTAVLALTLGAFATAPALAQTTPAPAGSQSLSLAPSGGAAATLPNTFDGPAATPIPAARRAVGPQVSDAQMAEAALRSVIEQFREGDIDETLFTPDVARRLNGQLATYVELIQSYGALESIETQNVSNGVGQFLVVFENAATQWQVGLEDGGLVAALRFREAPPESSEPSPADS